MVIFLLRCRSHGLAGDEGRPPFDCGDDFCYPLEKYKPSPTMLFVYSFIGVPRHTMQRHRIVHIVAQVAAGLFTVGLFTRIAALVAALALTEYIALCEFWTLGISGSAYGNGNNHLIMMLLYFAAAPSAPLPCSLDRALSVRSEAKPAGRQPFAIHAATLAYVGVCYWPAGFWKVWVRGLDWFLDENFFLSFISLHSTCGGMAYGTPLISGLLPSLPFSDHLLRQLIRVGSGSAVLMEVAFLPMALLLCCRPLARACLYSVLFSFHLGVVGLIHIDFWSLQWTFVALVEWFDMLPPLRSREPEPTQEKAVGAGRRVPLPGRQAAWAPLALAAAVTCGLQAYHGALADEGMDWPFGCYPLFASPWMKYQHVGTVFPCPAEASMWNMRLDFDPPMGGRTRINALTDLLPHHGNSFKNYAVFLESIPLRQDGERNTLGQLRLLLSMLRRRFDPTWRGRSVNVTAEIRVYSRSSGLAADLGEISLMPAQSFVVCSGRGGGELFGSGRDTDDDVDKNQWQVTVCGEVWDAAVHIDVTKGSYPTTFGGAPALGLECPEVVVAPPAASANAAPEVDCALLMGDSMVGKLLLWGSGDGDASSPWGPIEVDMDASDSSIVALACAHARQLALHPHPAGAPAAPPAMPPVVVGAAPASVAEVLQLYMPALQAGAVAGDDVLMVAVSMLKHMRLVQLVGALRVCIAASTGCRLPSPHGPTEWMRERLEGHEHAVTLRFRPEAAAGRGNLTDAGAVSYLLSSTGPHQTVLVLRPDVLLLRTLRAASPRGQVQWVLLQQDWEQLKEECRCQPPALPSATLMVWDEVPDGSVDALLVWQPVGFAEILMAIRTPVFEGKLRGGSWIVGPGFHAGNLDLMYVVYFLAAMNSFPVEVTEDGSWAIHCLSS